MDAFERIIAFLTLTKTEHFSKVSWFSTSINPNRYRWEKYEIIFLKTSFERGKNETGFSGTRQV
jgi:hypothetical protein